MSATTKIRATIGGEDWLIEVDTDPPLGWRFWRVAGWAGDPIDPTPYGGERCIPLLYWDRDGRHGHLCAMESDRTFRLYSPHMLFPTDDQDGAAEFGRSVLQGQALQPNLF